jgi:hypothetical protein
MAITLLKYVNITSAVGGASQVPVRQLGGMYLTTSSALLPNVVYVFDSLADVQTMFATNTPEYQAAAYYFGYLSKTATTPLKLSMFRWVLANIPPQITGASGISGNTVLTALKACTTANFNVTDSNNVVTPVNITGLNLSGAADFPTIAADLQTAFRANTNPQFANCTVLYTAATGQFTLQGGLSGSGLIQAVAGVSPTTDLNAHIGWLVANGATDSSGQSAQTPTQAISAAVAVTNNFGAFGFINSTTNPPTPLLDTDIVNVATWNNAQNNQFLYCAPTTIADASSISPQVIGFSGTALTINQNNDFAEFCPMEILAAIDWSRPSASLNFMFTQFSGRQPTITDTQTSNAMDALRINYIGQTQNAGAMVSFYQRGVVMGTAQSPTDLNTYCNEIWLKSDITSYLMNMFLALPRVPANNTGRGMVLTNLQYAINDAINNNVISVGESLNSIQKQFCTQVTGDPNAWQQVQTSGYWVNVTITSYQTTDSRTEYQANYILVYAMDNQIRKVVGSDILI